MLKLLIQGPHPENFHSRLTWGLHHGRTEKSSEMASVFQDLPPSIPPNFSLREIRKQWTSGWPHGSSPPPGKETSSTEDRRKLTGPRDLLQLVTVSLILGVLINPILQMRKLRLKKLKDSWSSTT